MSVLLNLTNAVIIGTNTLTASIFLQVVDFAKKFDLPEKAATLEDVKEINADVPGSALVKFRNGNEYGFDHGFVKRFESNHSYYELQDPGQIPHFYGKLNMDKNQAIAFARQKIREFGYPEEMFYADLKPDMHGPSQVGTNTIPFYYISWPVPNKSFPSIEFEINGEARRIEGVFILNSALWRDENGNKITNYLKLPKVPEEQNRRLMLAALPAIDKFANRLGLSVEDPISTNSIREFQFYQVDPELVGRIYLKSGISFSIKNGLVYRFAKSDEFFSAAGEIKVKDFVGTAKISDEEAILLAKTMAKRLGVDSRAMADEPRLLKPYGQAEELVPRLLVMWSPQDYSLPFVSAEIDKANATIRTFEVSPQRY